MDSFLLLRRLVAAIVFKGQTVSDYWWSRRTIFLTDGHWVLVVDNLLKGLRPYAGQNIGKGKQTNVELTSSVFLLTYCSIYRASRRATKLHILLLNVVVTTVDVADDDLEIGLKIYFTYYSRRPPTFPMGIWDSLEHLDYTSVSPTASNVHDTHTRIQGGINSWKYSSGITTQV